MADTNGQQVGRVVQIIGPVVDVEFSDSYLPPIYQALRITSEGFDVETTIDVVAEVQQHLGEGRVRAVSMLPTDGMVRGMKVIDLGGPITVPVGIPTLGRVMNVIGDPVDELGAVNAESALRFIATRRLLTNRRRNSKCLRRESRLLTLIQPFQTRRKDRSVRRRGRWQDGFDSGIDHQHRYRTQRLFGVCRCRRTNARRQRSFARIRRVGSYPYGKDLPTIWKRPANSI